MQTRPAGRATGDRRATINARPPTTSSAQRARCIAARAEAAHVGARGRRCRGGRRAAGGRAGRAGRARRAHSPRGLVVSTAVRGHTSARFGDPHPFASGALTTSHDVCWTRWPFGVRVSGPCTSGSRARELRDSSVVVQGLGPCLAVPQRCCVGGT